MTPTLARLARGPALALALASPAFAQTVASSGGSAATYAGQVAGVYNSTAPALSSGQGAALQLNSAGSLHTTIDNSNANGQTTMSGSSPVTLASNQSVADPCMFQAKSSAPFSSSSGSFQVVAPSGTTKIYVCATHYVVASAVNVSWIEGTGTACATGAAADVGSTTAASGMPIAANGGETLGSGQGSVFHTATGGDALCVLQSGTALIAGSISYVQQ